jgi:NTP pyrophosphatase (non-canonical NTP hydrolase)
MIDLRQKELKDWQDRNFPRSKYEHMGKDQLIDIIITMQCALGIAEEAGETCHHVLKGIQRIREGLNGIDKKQIADGVTDTLIYGLQLLSQNDVDAEKEIEEVTDKVLARDWTKDPSGKKAV